MLTTAGGLVPGDMEGHLFAYDADNGKQLWQFNAGSGVRGGPVSYAVQWRSTSSFRPASVRAPGFGRRLSASRSAGRRGTDRFLRLE